MDTWNFILAILIAALIIIVLMGLRSAARHMNVSAVRKKALVSLAKKRHWKINSSERQIGSRQLPPELLGQGLRHMMQNEIRGSVRSSPQHLRFVAGDLIVEDAIQTPTGARVPQVRCFSIAMFDLPYRKVPRIVIRREGFIDKLAAAFGVPDIEFGAEDFDPYFHIKCDDEPFARSFMQVPMMIFLKDRSRMPIVLDGDRCWITDGSAIWSAATLERIIDFMGEFFRIWPHEMLRDNYR